MLMHKVFLTFDTEDFTNTNSITALRIVLEMLDKYNFKTIFFITGHMAEKLEKFPNIVQLLNEHEIGYHSSSHSVRPAIFEFTDIEDYEKAYQISLERETSHINPLTGKIEGKGGIYSVKNLFPKKQIIAYRAPGCCWSPPHTQALQDLGIQFDFSSKLSSIPVFYGGLTFYPYPIIAQWSGKISDYRVFLLSAFKNEVTVIGLHPSLFTNLNEWDYDYWNGNPKQSIPPCPRKADEIKSLFHSFDFFLKQIKWLEKLKLIEVSLNLKKSEKNLTVTKETVEKCYEGSIRWAKRFFNYEPKFFQNHFYKFFNLSISNKEDNTNLDR